MPTGFPAENAVQQCRQTPHRELLQLPVERIAPNPYQPRRQFDEEGLNELKASIRESGLIQPLIVRRVGERYELIAGERRLRACKLLGMREVPCVVESGTGEQDSALMALVENVQRQGLYFLEEAECYRTVLRTYGMTQEMLAARLGKSQSFLANKLRILHLPAAVRKRMQQLRLTERHARALLRLPGEQLQLGVIERIREKGLNVKETERLVDRLLGADAPPPHPKLVRLLKDYRLFVNTVKYSADQLRDTGLNVEMTQTDYEDGVDMLIKVRR